MPDCLSSCAEGLAGIGCGCDAYHELVSEACARPRPSGIVEAATFLAAATALAAISTERRGLAPLESDFTYSGETASEIVQAILPCLYGRRLASVFEAERRQRRPAAITTPAQPEGQGVLL